MAGRGFLRGNWPPSPVSQHWTAGERGKQSDKPKETELCLSFFFRPKSRRHIRRRNTMMHKVLCGAFGALALTAWAFPIHAQDKGPALELAFMPSTMTVTLLNEGGKYVL